jgi:class 3 adenylate cyclase/predicted ATPase
MSHRKCGYCGSEWPVELEMRFCGQCGSKLGELSPEITDKERRTLTILFADLGGFTTFSEDRDPAEVEGIVDNLLAELASVVEQYGGYVDKFMGDAVMAVFGAPDAHEDDPLRAVRVGLEMLDSVSTFNEKRKYTLTLSVGVNTGEVIWSKIAGGDYTVTGDAVNVAQRLEAEAPSNTVFVSQAVEQRTRDAVQYDHKKAVSLKGRQSSVQPFAAVEVLPNRGEEPSASGNLAVAFQGREEQLERLIQASTTRKPSLLAVRGEAGIGKSRLFEELERRLHDRNGGMVFGRGQCRQHADVPREPFRDILLSRAEAGRGDTDAGERVVETVREELKGGIDDEVRRENVAHLLALSVGLNVPDARVTEMPGEQLRAEMRLAWWDWIRHHANENPVVLQLEDIQWADEQTLRLLDELGEQLTGWDSEGTNQITLLMNTRPGGEPPEAFETIELDPLTEAESRQIAESVLDHDVTDEVTKYLDRHACGNPYFVQQLLRYLRDNDLFARSNGSYSLDESSLTETTVPETLEGLLVGRIDTLRPAPKETLKGASVVGERFWENLLSETLDQGTDQPLRTLTGRGMVEPRPESTLPDDREFAFEHALLRDTAYDLLPTSNREHLHRRVAVALEDVADHGSSIAPTALTMAGQHATQAGDYEKAVTCYWQAGETASERHANDVAIEAYRQALTLADEHDAGTTQTVASLAAELASVYSTTGELDRASDVVETGLAAAPDESEIQCRLLDERAKVLHEQSRYDVAETIANRQRDLARILETPSLEAKAFSTLGWIAEDRGEYEQAEKYHEQSLTISEDTGNRTGQAQSLKDLGNVVLRIGSNERAVEYFERSLSIFEELGDRNGQAGSLNGIGTACLGLHELERATECLEESLELKEEIGNRAGQARSLGNLGNIARNRGRYERATEYLEQCLELFRDMGNQLAEAKALHNLGSVAEQRGETEQAIEYHEQSLAIDEETGARPGKAASLHELGGIAVGRGKYDRAEDHLQRSLDINEDIGHQVGQATALHHLGERASACGALEQATKYLQRSLSIYEDSDNPASQVRVLASLAGGARRRNQLDDADEFLTRASDIVTEIDTHGVTIAVHREQAALARRQNDYDLARHHLTEAHTAYEASDGPQRPVQVLLEESRLALETGNTAHARELVEEVQTTLDDRERPLEDGRASVLRGRVAAHAEKPAVAGDHYEDALAIFEDIGAILDALETLETLTELARDRGDTEQARAWYQQARDILKDAPASLAESHGEWVRDHESSLAERDAETGATDNGQLSRSDRT